MRTTYTETLASRVARSRALALERDDLPRLAAMGGIVVLAAVLRLANLASLGYANHYYAAAVESMLQSWHNFFFVAAEPGGAVSVDKPPVGLWVQAISAHFLGLNSLGLLLPQILAGLASVVLVYYLARRSFGTVAGLLAALALAITPIVVATDRNNTIDSTLILTLLLAAWAFIVATEQGKLRYLLLGAVLVGIGFNIKMLEAYLPLPAFLALYFLGSKEGLWRKVGNLALASALLLVVSFSWAVAVDLTPAGQRPFVGSSGDNSVMSLAIGYNGVERLLGMNGRGGLLTGLFGGTQGRFQGPGTRGTFPAGTGPSRGGILPPAGGAGPSSGWSFPSPGTGPSAGGAVSPAGPGTGSGFQPDGRADGRSRQPGAGGASQPNWQGGSPGFPMGGMGGTGRAGALRLFTAPLSKEISWLLPFGLFGMVLLAARTRPRWPIARKHQALVLWGGWLLTGVVFFSVAGFFHEYYLSMLAPSLAALVGIGTSELWRVREIGRWPHRWIAAALLVTAAGGTLALQVSTARSFTTDSWWMPAAYGLLAIGALALLAAAIRNRRRIAISGFACVVAAIMLTPGVWAGLTTANSSANQSLPSAYSGRPSGPANGGGLQVNQVSAGLPGGQHPGSQVSHGGTQLNAGSRLRPGDGAAGSVPGWVHGAGRGGHDR